MLRVFPLDQKQDHGVLIAPLLFRGGPCKHSKKTKKGGLARTGKKNAITNRLHDCLYTQNSRTYR